MLVPGAVLCSCRAPRASENSLREHVEELKKRTIPSDTRVIAISDPKIGEWSATASWKIETDLSEAQYRRWVVSQLRLEWREPKAIDSRFVFLRDLNGDVESLTVEVRHGPSRLQVAVRLEIYPE